MSDNPNYGLVINETKSTTIINVSGSYRTDYVTVSSLKNTTLSVSYTKDSSLNSGDDEFKVQITNVHLA